MSPYLELYEKYLRDAEELAMKRDLVQASEKYWGAVAEIIKEIASRRDWPHYRHRDLFLAADQLFRETGDKTILQGFQAAESLHANFYENFMSPEAFDVSAVNVKLLIGKLKSLNGSI